MRLLKALAACCVLPLLGLSAWVSLPVSLPAARASARVLDRSGLLVAEMTGEGLAPGQPVAQLPATLRAALVAAEDHRFYQHPGVDLYAVARAALANLQAGEVVQGASTLPMQLARNLWPRPRGMRGKLWEAAWALRLSAHLERDDLLTEYANRVYYGHQAWGIDAASRAYFDTSPQGLSVAQAALLAGLPQQPSRLDPYRHPQAARARRDSVLRQMSALGELDPSELELALAEPVLLHPSTSVLHAPHFVRRLNPQPGQTRSTLELGLQLEVERLLEQHLLQLVGQEVDHGAVIVLDTQSSEVLAYVGSGGWDSASGQVDGVTAPRSPGSTLKPFLYAMALEQGHITLATLLSDSSGAWSTTHGAWHPRNYDERDLGPMRARVALATSRNLPAVRLLETVGVGSLLSRLQDLGLRSLDRTASHYGLGLILGSGEVTLETLAAAYATMGRQGLVLPVQTRVGERAAGKWVGERAAWWLVLDALDDPDARAPAFGVDSILEAGAGVSAKTGTSVGWRDNWAVAVTPKVVVAVWVGNFDGRPMRAVSGLSGAGPLMAQVLAVADPQPTPHKRPPGLVSVPICLPSGMAPSASCASTGREHFVRGTQPQEPDTWWTQIQVDSSGALATGCPGASKQVVLRYPAEHRLWAQQTGRDAWPSQDRSCTPTPAGEVERAHILSPAPDSLWYLDPDRPAQRQGIALRAGGELLNDQGLGQVTWTVDDEPVGQGPLHHQARWVPTAGRHRVALYQDQRLLDEIVIWVGSSQPPERTP